MLKSNSHNVSQARIRIKEFNNLTGIFTDFDKYEQELENNSIISHNAIHNFLSATEYKIPWCLWKWKTE